MHMYADLEIRDDISCPLSDLDSKLESELCDS